MVAGAWVVGGEPGAVEGGVEAPAVVVGAGRVVVDSPAIVAGATVPRVSFAGEEWKVSTPVRPTMVPNSTKGARCIRLS